MKSASSPASFSARHIALLREQLSLWSDDRAVAAGGSDFIDLWFVDSDVLSTFINAAPHNYISEWPSLFSLDDSSNSLKRGSEVEAAAKAVTDGIALAVSYFLFGRFRESLTTQTRRFLILPEHDRELDAMTIAVSYETQRNAPTWMSAITAQYLRLASAEHQEDLNKTFAAIFQLLRDGSPASKLSRVTDLRRQLLTRLDRSLALFPTDEPGTAFAFRPDDTELKGHIQALAKDGFSVFLDSLVGADPAIERYRSLKQTVFELHSPDRLMRSYVDNVARTFDPAKEDSSNESSRWISQLDVEALTTQTKIAARQVSDVYALARLVAVAKFLNTQHEQKNKSWRLNLITGSKQQRRLLSAWGLTNSQVKSVRLVHPLSAMGIDGFAQPDEGEPGGYALRALRLSDASTPEVDQFFSDFLGLLSAAAVSYAPNRERWMRGLRLQLSQLKPESRGQYLRHIRDAISRDYAATFAQLNVDSHSVFGQLPSVSLPALALPLQDSDPSPAQEFVTLLHEGDEGRSRATRFRRRLGGKPQVLLPMAELNIADPTGYSALLCTGLGFLAKGRQWLPIASAIADTAVAFAGTPVVGDPDESYPEGNEAHYFAAFVSRMRVSPSSASRELAIEWHIAHSQLMNQATERLCDWAKLPIAARRIAVGRDSADGAVTLSDVVSLRYDVERVAADVFGLLIDLLEPADQKIVPTSAGDVLEKCRDHWLRWEKVSSFPPHRTYRADVEFVGAQIAAMSMQAWLCASAVAPPSTAPRSQSTEGRDSWLTDRVRRLTDPLTAPGSTLLHVLAAIYRSRVVLKNSKDASIERASRSIRDMQFATLDEVRAPFFARLLASPEVPVRELLRPRSGALSRT